MAQATLTINSHNYGAWSLRGWLLCRFAGLDFDLEIKDPHDPDQRAELLLMSPSVLVPSLTVDDLEIWDTLAIGEYLAERNPDLGLLPSAAPARSQCRSVCGEMHSGFASLRAAMPMNVKARHSEFKIFVGAQADLDRIIQIWTRCLTASGGPFMFGDRPTIADAMYAPVCTRVRTYGITLADPCRSYVDHMLALDELVEWASAAQAEPDEDLVELDAEF